MRLGSFATRLPRALRLPILDRYLLGSMISPMAAGFAVVLISLMLTRALELVNVLAASSAQFHLIGQLMGDLVPHYVGLAVPASYFISVFVVVSRLSDSNELDAILASGVSMERIALPFVCVGLGLSVLSVGLLGYIQPLSRYDYNAVFDSALYSQWNARLQPKVFMTAGEDVVITADRSDAAGRELGGVLVRWRLPDGRERIVSAERARIAASPDGDHASLLFQNGHQLEELASGEATVGMFDRLTVALPDSQAARVFRPRGAVERELTLSELFERMRSGSSPDVRNHAASEAYIRLVRSFSPPLLPLLALPLGIAAKRGNRGFGVILAALILLLYEYSIEFAQGLADTHGWSPTLVGWTPFVLFAALCIWLFVAGRERPGQTPFGAIIDQMSATASTLKSWLNRAGSSH